MRDTFIFYRSFFEAIKELPAVNQAELFSAICAYSLDQTTPELTGISKTVWILIKPILDANNKRFENGSKPKKKQNVSKTEAKQKQDVSEVEANKDKDKDLYKDKDKNVDVDIFLAHCKSFLGEKYQSLEYSLRAKHEAWVSDGWKDGNGKKIKNWKTKIKNTVPFLKPMQVQEKRDSYVPTQNTQW